MNIIGSVFYGTILGVFLVAFFLKQVQGKAVFWAAVVSELLILFIYTQDWVGLWLNVLGALFTVVLSLVFQPCIIENNESQPPAKAEEIHWIVDYFYQCNSADLKRMGIAPLLPPPKKWVKNIQHQMALADTEKELYYLLWRLNEQLVGHSNLSHLVYGKTAKVHLHLWSSEKRQSGLGKLFTEQCLAHYFSRFTLPEISANLRWTILRPTA